MELMPGYDSESNDETGYISLTTKYRVIWKLMFELSSRRRDSSNRVLASTIYRRFRKLIDECKPDVILSVHPCFVGSVIICLQRMRLDIPVCTCIIDLVKHSRLWHDTRCEKTFVPTNKMYRQLLGEGFTSDKLVHSGFPIGEAFHVDVTARNNRSQTVDMLMVNPSLEQDDVTLEFIRVALKFKVKLTVVTGSDRQLKTYLDQHLSNRPDVDVLGYVHDMPDRLAAADLIVTKAGPNMMLEAVSMCVPILITGHILGQEEENYTYVVDNGYGMKCESPAEFESALNTILVDDADSLSRMRANEMACKDTNGAPVIARNLIDIVVKRRSRVD